MQLARPFLSPARLLLLDSSSFWFRLFLFLTFWSMKIETKKDRLLPDICYHLWSPLTAWICVFKSLTSALKIEGSNLYLRCYIFHQKIVSMYLHCKSLNYICNFSVFTM